MHKRLTTEEFILRMNEIGNGEYELRNEYRSCSKKVLLYHKVCGTEFEMLAGNFLAGHGCPVCNRKKKADKLRKSHESFLDEISNIVGNEYTVLSEYIGAFKEVLFRHNTCGCEFLMTPDAFLNGGYRCPVCRKKKNDDRLRSFAKNRTEKAKTKFIAFMQDNYPDYEILSEIKDTATNVVLKHKCGCKFQITPSNFYGGQRCPDCTSGRSHAAYIIQHFLEDNKINYKPEYAFKDLKSPRNQFLRFDFAILNEDNTVNCLIEFDGIQHFQPVDYFGGEDELKRIQIRDNLKNDYCKKNNIILYRISYLDDLEKSLVQIKEKIYYKQEKDEV